MHVSRCPTLNRSRMHRGMHGCGHLVVGCGLSMSVGVLLPQRLTGGMLVAGGQVFGTHEMATVPWLMPADPTSIARYETEMATSRPCCRQSPVDVRCSAWSAEDAMQADLLPRQSMGPEERQVRPCVRSWGLTRPAWAASYKRSRRPCGLRADD